jgi:hypothetical protein
LCLRSGDITAERLAKNKEALEDVSRSGRLEGTSRKNCNDLVIPEEKNRSQEKGASLSSL